MTHCSQIVNFVRLHICNDSNEIRRIAQITIMQKKFDSSLMTITIDVINTAGVEGGGTTNDSMNL